MRAYRFLCGVLGFAFVLFGVALVLGFFRALLPGAQASGPLPAGTDYDREGRVRFVDVREDFHIWIDSSVLAAALAEIP